MSDEQQPEPYLRIRFKGGKQSLTEVPLDAVSTLDVTDGGVLVIGDGSELNFYSPSAWEYIETNLDLDA